MKVSTTLTTGILFLALPFFVFASPATGTDLFRDLTGFVTDRLLGDRNLEQNTFVFDNVIGSGDINRPLFGFFPAPEFWTVDDGHVELNVNGDFFADLFGLRADGQVIAGFEIAALVFCQDGSLVHDTGFFLSNDFGDVLIDDFVILPDSCFSPTVIFVDNADFLIAAAGSGVAF